MVPAVDKQLTLKRAGALLRRGLKSYSNLVVSQCRHDSPRAVSCQIASGGWSGHASVQLRPHHVARISYTLEG